MHEFMFKHKAMGVAMKSHIVDSTYQEIQQMKYFLGSPTVLGHPHMDANQLHLYSAWASRL